MDLFTYNFHDCPLEVSKYATYIYYRGTDNNLWRVTKRFPPAPPAIALRLTTNGNVTTDEILADALSEDKVFYLSNNMIWNCFLSGSNWYNLALTWDVKAQNVAGDLACNKDGSMLYYRSLDGELWYFFTDKGWTNGGGHWYNSPVDCKKIFHAFFPNSKVSGPIIVRDDGTVFYRNTDGRLIQIDWKVDEVDLGCNSQYDRVILY